MLKSTLLILIIIFGVYVLIGFLFGLYFIFKGAKQIDPLIAESKFSVRLLLFPGTIAAWPFLITKIFKK